MFFSRFKKLSFSSLSIKHQQKTFINVFGATVPTAAVKIRISNKFLFRSYVGQGQSQILVIDKVRILRSRPHTPTPQEGDGKQKGCKASALCQFELGLVGDGKLGANLGITK